MSHVHACEADFGQSLAQTLSQLGKPAASVLGRFTLAPQAWRRVARVWGVFGAVGEDDWAGCGVCFCRVCVHCVCVKVFHFGI